MDIGYLQVFPCCFTFVDLSHSFLFRLKNQPWIWGNCWSNVFDKTTISATNGLRLPYNDKASMKPTPEEKARPGKTWGFKIWRSFWVRNEELGVHIFRFVSLVATDVKGDTAWVLMCHVPSQASPISFHYTILSAFDKNQSCTSWLQCLSHLLWSFRNNEDEFHELPVPGELFLPWTVFFGSHRTFHLYPSTMARKESREERWARCLVLQHIDGRRKKGRVAHKRSPFYLGKFRPNIMARLIL